MHNNMTYYIKRIKFCGYTVTQILTQAFGVVAEAIGFFQTKTYRIHQKQAKPFNQVEIARAYRVTPKAVSAMLARHKYPLPPLTESVNATLKVASTDSDSGGREEGISKGRFNCCNRN
jgi:hypothetical protein